MGPVLNVGIMVLSLDTGLQMPDVQKTVSVSISSIAQKYSPDTDLDRFMHE